MRTSPSYLMSPVSWPACEAHFFLPGLGLFVPCSLFPQRDRPNLQVPFILNPQQSVNINIYRLFAYGVKASSCGENVVVMGLGLGLVETNV